MTNVSMVCNPNPVLEPGPVAGDLWMPRGGCGTTDSESNLRELPGELRRAEWLRRGPVERFDHYPSRRDRSRIPPFLGIHRERIQQGFGGEG